jgi:hypothetical protein
VTVAVSSGSGSGRGRTLENFVVVYKWGEKVSQMLALFSKLKKRKIFSEVWV